MHVEQICARLQLVMQAGKLFASFFLFFFCSF